MARLTEKQRNAAVVQQLRELVDVRFEGNMTQAAKALGVATAYVSNLLSGDRKPGLKLMLALADVSGRPFADVVGEREPRWADAPEWTSAIGEARRRFGGASDAAWSWLASLAGPLPPRADPTALGMMAVAWDQAAPPSAEAEPATKPAAKKPRAA